MHTDRLQIITGDCREVLKTLPGKSVQCCMPESVTDRPTRSHEYIFLLTKRDPFGGSGTTGQVALELGRRAVLIELNPEYAKLSVTSPLALA